MSVAPSPARISFTYGVFVALVTPFDADGALDEPRLRGLIRRLTDAVDGFVTSGTTGEFPYLSGAERRRLVEIAVEEAQGKPVVAGAGAPSTREALRHVDAAARAGAAACLVVAPYYLRPSARGLHDHFGAVAEASPVPLVLYDIPQLVGAPLPPGVVDDLAARPNVLAVKDSSGDLRHTLELLEAARGRIDVLVGHDEVVLPALVAGCRGMILGGANVVAHVWQAVLAAHRAGDLATARRLQTRVQGPNRIFARHGGPVAVKAALEEVGAGVGTPRRPLLASGGGLSQARRSALGRDLRRVAAADAAETSGEGEAETGAGVAHAAGPLAGRLRGVLPALVTPFDAREDVDEGALRRLIRHLLPEVDGVVPVGTTGEFVQLTGDEKRRVIEATLDEVAGRVPVIAGTGCASTADTVALTRFARDAGADAALVVTPFYFRPTDDEVRAHFDAVDRVGLPTLVYDIPSCTGTHLRPETVAALARLDHVVGLKDSSGDVASLMTLLGRLGPGFVGVCGHDEVVLPALAAGARAAILASANLVPRLWRGLFDAVARGDLEAARAHQTAALPLARLVARRAPTEVVKAGLGMMGIDVGMPRRPLAPSGLFTDRDRAALHRELARHGVVAGPAPEGAHGP